MKNKASKNKSNKKAILSKKMAASGNRPEQPPPIKEKDSKILWARAAGRCSMETCKAVLTFDTAKKSSVTIGEMCHIVGEKSTSPRGKSNLDMKERSNYSNLVLMCAHHHKIIDRAVDKYRLSDCIALKMRMNYG